LNLSGEGKSIISSRSPGVKTLYSLLQFAVLFIRATPLVCIFVVKNTLPWDAALFYPTLILWISLASQT